MSFYDWYREYKHPDNFAPSLEEAYNAGMERAAQIAEERGHLALPHVIREEIEDDYT